MTSSEQFLNINALLFVFILLLCSFVDGWVSHYRIWYLPSAVAYLVIGFFLGLIVTLAKVETEAAIVAFNPELFFFLFLPPIIFEGGYTLKRKNFFVNLGTILNFAVFGTMLSTFLFGIFLYAFACADLVPIHSLIECLMFGALISATDPIATLAMLTSAAETAAPPPLLFSLIFGESILNDAVAIVLFTTFKLFAQVDVEGVVSDVGVSAVKILEAIGYFIGVSLGSIAIGVSAALACSLLFRKLDGLEIHAYVELSVVALFAYTAYILAEISSLSGIMSIFFCSICLAHYNFYNLSGPGKVTTVEAFKCIARLCEMFVFLFIGTTLGLSVDGLEVNGNNGWNNGDMPITWSGYLILVSLIGIILARILTVFPLSYLSNCLRASPITLNQQIFLCFAGLRGAVAFAVAMNFPGINRGAIVSTTLIIIVFTSICCGVPTYPLLSWLKLLDSFDHGLRLLKQTDLEQKDVNANSPPTHSITVTRPVMTERKCTSAAVSFEDRQNDEREKEAVNALTVTELKNDNSLTVTTPDQLIKFNTSTISQASSNLPFALATPPSLPAFSPHPLQMDYHSTFPHNHHHQQQHVASPELESTSLYGRLLQRWNAFDRSVMFRIFGGYRTGRVERHADDLVNIQLRIQGHTHTAHHTAIRGVIDPLEENEIGEQLEMTVADADEKKNTHRNVHGEHMGQRA